MTREHFCDAWVCTDCYFAHHYGAYQHEEDIVLYDEDGNLVDETVPLWYAGEDDEPVGGWHEIRHNHTLNHNREPLGLIEDDVEVFDNTCSDHYYGQEPVEDEHGVLVPECEQCGTTTWEDGIEEFSWSRCEGCGSPLGGSRYRLSLWMTKEVNA